VPIPERRLVEVFLNHVAGLTFVEGGRRLLVLARVVDKTADVAACRRVRIRSVRVKLGCVVLFFLLEELLVLLSMLLSGRVYLLLHLLEIVRYKDAAPLTPSFRLGYV